ncbi:hypothetical protein F4803DRAFT_552126 [Xylaria telfairii]|nr:hypothetical protein F4803DRAFT_552126 [Xylaria telfairii]
MSSIQGQANTTNQRPRQRGPTSRRSTPCWQTGDIAFLKPADAFNDREWSELLNSRRVPINATGHPVIILAMSDDSRYYIVTTVSAYSSSEENNFLAPWKQAFHKRKDINGFRAFEGCERPNEKFDFLRLAEKKKWPKEKTSWVYIHNPCLVPVTTLLRYTKPRTSLRMEPESLQGLLSHMEEKSRKFRDQKVEMARMTPAQPAPEPQQQKVEAVVQTAPTQPAPAPANLEKQTAEMISKVAAPTQPTPTMPQQQKGETVVKPAPAIPKQQAAGIVAKRAPIQPALPKPQQKKVEAVVKMPVIQPALPKLPQRKVEIVVKMPPTQPTPAPANLQQQPVEIMAKRAPKQPVVRNLHLNWRQNGKENASCPVVAHVDGASEKAKPSDGVVDAAKSMPLFNYAGALKSVMLA